MTTSIISKRIATLKAERAELRNNFEQANQVIGNIRQRFAEIEGALKELQPLVPEESEASDTEGAETLQE